MKQKQSITDQQKKFWTAYKKEMDRQQKLKEQQEINARKKDVLTRIAKAAWYSYLVDPATDKPLMVLHFGSKSKDDELYYAKDVARIHGMPFTKDTVKVAKMTLDEYLRLINTILKSDPHYKTTWDKLGWDMDVLISDYFYDNIFRVMLNELVNQWKQNQSKTTKPHTSRKR